MFISIVYFIVKFTWFNRICYGVILSGVFIYCGSYCDDYYRTFKVATGQAEPHMQSAVGTAVPGVSLFLLLKAFSSGASSLTGVEAISNAVTNFKEPGPNNAVKTLIAMGSILGFLLVGIVGLSYWYGILPQEETTVLSQLAKHVLGQNVAYYFVQATTVMILVLAANTGFTAFPMLAASMAKDKYMPVMLRREVID